MGKGILAFLSALAEDERERITRRANEGRAIEAKQGVRFGRNGGPIQMEHSRIKSGVFEGEYHLTILADGKFRGEGLAGAEVGINFVQDGYYATEIADGIHMISWLETDSENAGYTVTVLINTIDSTVHGVISNETGHFPRHAFNRLCYRKKADFQFPPKMAESSCSFL